MTRLSPHAAFWLTIVRIYVGVFWLIHGLAKLAGGKPVYLPSWYHGLLVSSAHQYAHSYFQIVAAAEVLVGVLLIFGLFTRAAAFVALLLAAGFLLTKGGYTSYEGIAGTAPALIVMSLVTFALAADFGLDGIRRYARERQSVRVERVEATPVDVKWPQ